MKTTASETELIAEAIGKFEPSVATMILEVRAALRERFPTAYELVYDNFNFFVIGYCATERPSHCVVSIAADAKGVALSFYRGADIDDPLGLLSGSGKQNRFLRLPQGAASLTAPGVPELLDRAEALAPQAMRESGTLVTVLRSISEKQRPRRRTESRPSS
ncbi:MAG: hypothetical protein WCE44_13800 [Candidatus Velthaea sp.]|jgi:hypothetical protein